MLMFRGLSKLVRIFLKRYLCVCMCTRVCTYAYAYVCTRARVCVRICAYRFKQKWLSELHSVGQMLSTWVIFCRIVNKYYTPQAWKHWGCSMFTLFCKPLIIYYEHVSATKFWWPFFFNVCLKLQMIFYF